LLWCILLLFLARNVFNHVWPLVYCCLTLSNYVYRLCIIADAIAEMADLFAAHMDEFFST
jgi:hypothetical protein